MKGWKDFQGVNLGFALELYDRFLKDARAVDAGTRKFFEQFPPPSNGSAPQAAATGTDADKIVGAVNLAESLRKFGHMDAQIDPLESPPPGDPSLLLETHGVTEEILEQLPAGLDVREEVAKAILAAGRFAAHENAIWRQTKPIKRLPEHYRIRISVDYRMIVRWQPGKSLRILDVIPRQDLESWIKRHG